MAEKALTRTNWHFYLWAGSDREVLHIWPTNNIVETGYSNREVLVSTSHHIKFNSTIDGAILRTRIFVNRIRNHRFPTIDSFGLT